MFRPATRLIARTSAVRAIPRAPAPARRFLSTAPPTQKSRSWKSLAARLGIVGTIIYYYNTTEVFAEEPKYPVHALPEIDDETTQLPTIEDVAKERQQRKAEIAAAEQEASAQETAAASEGGLEELGAEADQQGAFNPETGEINWDCPCLGGMANGPCGEEFKEAFSCFIFSTEEPKGMDCIEKFKGMQNCFREYPEIYGTELESDEDGADDVALENDLLESATSDGVDASTEVKPTPLQNSDTAKVTKGTKRDHGLVPESYRPSEDSKAEQVKDTTEQVRQEHEPVNESEKLVPKAAHDGTEAEPKN